MNIYEDMAQEIIFVFSQLVKDKKQMNAKNISDLLMDNEKISKLISSKKTDVNKAEIEEMKKKLEEFEKMKSSMRENYLKLDEIEADAEKKLELFMRYIRTLSIMAKTQKESQINTIIEEVNKNLKSPKEINRELIEHNLTRLKNEILKFDGEEKTQEDKKEEIKPSEPQKKSFLAGLFKKDIQSRAPQDDKENLEFNKNVRELLLSVVFRLQIEKVEEINNKIQSLSSSIKKENLTVAINKIKADICDLIEIFREKLDSDKNTLYEAIHEIATGLIDTEQELLVAFNNSQFQTNNSNKTFYETVNMDINGIESSFSESDSVEGIKQLVFKKLGNIKKSIHEKKQRDEKIDKENASHINRIEEDLKKNKNEIKKMQDMTDRDGLTGSYNRNAFQRRLNEEFKRFKENKNSCSLITLDIDNLKHINDAYGYDNGDRILQTVAKVINGNILDTYFFARYGGGEFALIFPDVPGNISLKVVEKLKKNIEDIDFNYLGEKVPVTASFGISEFQERQTAIQTFQKAHEAMNSAKKKGKNQIGIN